MATPLVLLVSKHEAFASMVCEQLSGNSVAVRVLSPREACESHRFPDRFPDVAFVDHEARTTGGLPLYQALKVALQGCRIILVCKAEQAFDAAQAVRSRDAFDYILVDSFNDRNRIFLLVERACIDGTAGHPDHPDTTTKQRQRILETLNELRGILKSPGENPVVRLIDSYRATSVDSSRTFNPLERRLAESYHSSLVDLICGRLKRLENAVRFSGNEEVEAPIRGTGTCVLVVEDDAVCGEMAKYILERHGFDVVLATTAGDAKAALTRHGPAIVLMDVHLGETNGLWLIKAMRAGHTCPDVPVVVVSSDRMQGTVHDAVELDVQGYLLKPYKPSLMVETVRNALAKAELGRLRAAQG
ncbi:MAG TPA: response regulator [Thermoguttaceae bacterium]|nr:response regulator [Thermoguttaceae bacterium]